MRSNISIEPTDLGLLIDLSVMRNNKDINNFMHTISEKQSSAIQRDRQNTKREINILRNDSENTDQAFENTNKLIKKTNDYLKSTLYAVAYNINVEPGEQYFNENTLKELARLPLAA